MVDEILARLNEIDFSSIFIIDDTKKYTMTYASFFEYCICLANYIDENIAVKTVSVIMENSFELASLYFAVMFTNKEIAVIDPQKGNDEINILIEEIAPTIIITDDSVNAFQNDAYEIFSFPKLVPKSWDINELKKYTICKITQRFHTNFYLLTYTSGTSGHTKGVRHSLSNLFLSALALSKKVNKNGGSMLHVLPMTYMAGILNSLIYPFLIGANIVLIGRFSITIARKFWDKVIEYDIDLLWLSPSMLMMIDQLDRGHKGEQYCKKKNITFLIGTAPLNNELRNRFNARYGVHLYASYGLSETLFISVETEESLRKSDINCVGEALEGVAFKFNENGELNIRVPWMYLGYTNENTRLYFNGEYYKSGDLAKIGNGYLYITGRSKDLIIKGGMNISPVLIENTVLRVNGVSEVAIIGVPDIGEEKICCVYVTESEINDFSSAKMEQAIKKSVLRTLGKIYTIDFFWHMDNLPRNINGKIDKKNLKKRWGTRKND